MSNMTSGNKITKINIYQYIVLIFSMFILLPMVRLLICINKNVIIKEMSALCLIKIHLIKKNLFFTVLYTNE